MMANPRIKLILVALLLVNLLASNDAKLLYGMKPCARDLVDFDACVLRMVSDAMSYILGGSSLFGKVDPLQMSNFTGNVNGGGITLNVKGKDILLRGLKTASCSNFKFDLRDMKMSFDVSIPTMKLDGTCSVTGHIQDAGIYADGERFPLAVMHTVTEGFSASFFFKFHEKVNASGTFLIPSPTSYDSNPGSGTSSFENLFAPGYVPGEEQRELMKKAEEAFAKVVAGTLESILRQIIPTSVSVIMEANAYDRLYPENQAAAFRIESESGTSALTASYLSTTVAVCTVLLLRTF